MKEKVNVFDYSKEITEALSQGILLNTKVGNKFNTMTVSWGGLGRFWEKPTFTVYVRQHRCTHKLLEQNGEFTMSIPLGEFNRKILGIAGTKSGNDIDKVSALGITLEMPEVNNVPGICELPLTIECRVLYKQTHDLDVFLEEAKNTFYPQEVDGSFHGANKDVHTEYIGEIVDAYIIRP